MPMTRFNADAFVQFEKTGWENKAGGYHAFYAPITGRVIDDLLDAAGVSEGTRVLDIGSGPGYVTAQAVARGARAVGVDFSESMVELARQTYPGLAFEVGDTHDLRYPHGRFESVVGNFVLHHLADQPRALREAARVLRPGGRVALTAWDDFVRCRFLGVFADSVAQAGVSAPDALPSGPPMATTDAGYVALLGAVGFKAARVRRISWIHRFPGAQQLWDGLLAASVRTAALITGQAPEVQERIRHVFDEVIAEYEVASGLEVPVSVVLLSGSTC